MMTVRCSRSLGLVSLVAGLLVWSGVAQAQNVKHGDLDATIKAESAAIQSGVTAEGTSIKTEVGAQHTATKGAIGVAQTAIQGTVQTESTAVQNALVNVQNELTAQHATIETTLSSILGRLDDLEAKIDNQTTDLSGVTQNWDKKLDSTNGDANGCNSDRFTCLWPDGNGSLTAVRDNETGLVWERDPDAGDKSWTAAMTHCANRNVGGRKGWSLPMREQLATLVDTSSTDPALPTDHPFLNVLSTFYRSASSVADNPTFAWGVLFFNGFVDGSDKNSSIENHAWCVRGGQTYDGQDVQEVIDALP